MSKIRDELKNEPIVLAHHPMCGRYDDHFFIISGRKICRGCLTVYPSAIAVFLVLMLLGIDDFWTLFGAAFVLFMINSLRILIDRSKAMNIIFNIMLGTILALTIQAILHCPDELKIVIYPFVVLSAFAFMGIRGWKLLLSCKKCPDYRNFPACARGK
ncbi:MAG: hypothetical protein HPY73_04405 [Methanomassiliicoccales archaeon]|nr:MAG: hypothetical protein HPY73_04405 [Methanomassiliicoccales archaeon]